MSRHTLRKRPEGRLQCTQCRAAFLVPENAERARAACMGRPLPHGHPYSREHVVYPTWYDQGNGRGPDRLCDELACFCMHHECDCDVCMEVIDVPALNVLNDSHEPEVEISMTNKTEVHLPAALRKWAVRDLEVETQAERDLMDACKALGLGNSQRSTTVPLGNAALGVLIKQARKWGTSKNGNEVMASKSVLSRHELDYEPADLSEVRYGIKMPKSLSGEILTKVRNWGAEDLSGDVGHQLTICSWTSTGMTGRVGHEALGWLLEEIRPMLINSTGAIPRAADKFIQTYRPQYEEQAAKWSEAEKMTAAGFMEAIHGRGGSEEQPKRLVVIACGGKKSDAPGKIPAGERYTGNYFTACRLAADVMDGPTMVLSAKYGLIPLSEEIEDYDVRMGDKGSVRLGAVRQQVEELGLEDAKVTVLGGEKYVKGARQIWPDAEAPLKGGIGQQLKQLAGMYEGEALENDEQSEEKPEGPCEWKSGVFRDVMGLPGRYSSNSPVIWFGGKAGKANPQPGKWRKVKIHYIGEGRYDLTDLETGEDVFTAALVSKVHWAPGIGKREFDEWRESRQDEPAPVEEVMPPGGYEVPENFLELAEEANTEAAKRYWKRRCEQWAKEGK